MVALKDEPDVLITQVASLVLIQFVDRLIEEVILARPGAVMHADQMQQRGLPGAGRSHDGNKFAFFDFRVDAPQDESLSNTMGVELLDVSQFDHKIRLSVVSCRLPVKTLANSTPRRGLTGNRQPATGNYFRYAKRAGHPPWTRC